MVKEHVAVCFQLEAPVADVIGGARLRPHALELALHDVHRNQREQHAEQKGNRDPDQGERLLGQIAGVIDIAVLRLGDEPVGKLGEADKGVVVIRVAEIRRNLFADVVDTRQRKGLHTVALGGDPPVAVLHGHEQQCAVVGIAVIVVIVVGIFHGRFSAQRIRRDDDEIHLLLRGNLPQAKLELALIIIGHQVRVVHDAGLSAHAGQRKGRSRQKHEKAKQYGNCKDPTFHVLCPPYSSHISQRTRNTAAPKMAV